MLEWQGATHVEAEIEKPNELEWMFDNGTSVEFEKSGIEPPKRQRTLESIAQMGLAIAPFTMGTRS